jgi:hypothetical protein
MRVTARVLLVVTLGNTWDVGPMGGMEALMPSDVKDGLDKLEHELAMLRHVLSVNLEHPTPFDVRVRILMDAWDWDVWQFIHDRVDDKARECVDRVTLTAEVTVAEDSPTTVDA